jgi:hypothetical protein
MGVARVRFARLVMLAGAVFAGGAIAGTPAAWAQTATAAVGQSFKLDLYPAYTTAGLPTTFVVTVTNTSSTTTTLKSVQVTPPTGFTVARPRSIGTLRRKTFVHGRTFSLHGIAVSPGKKMRFDVVATPPAGKCGHVRLRWTSHAFTGAAASGPELGLQSAGSGVGVTVVCPQLAPCGDGGPACSTNVPTSVSSYGVVSNASSGTLQGTLDVGTRLRCPGYTFHDPNWYNTLVVPPAAGFPPGTAPIVDTVSYTIRNTTTQGLGFCLGAGYDFTTASGAQAPPGRLPTGKTGFIGLLPMCTAGGPPCIKSISPQVDPAAATTGHDAVMTVQIPELGDPWGSG